MDTYMNKNKNKNKFSLENLIGKIDQKSLVGQNGISSNGLSNLVENIIHEIMNKEKNAF